MKRKAIRVLAILSSIVFLLLIYIRLFFSRLFGLRNLFNLRINNAKPDDDHRQFPEKNLRILKFVFFVRGLLRRNDILKDIANRNLHEGAEAIKSKYAPAIPKEIERVDYKHIKEDEKGFCSEYFLNPRPLIITGANIDLSLWSLERFFRDLGQVDVLFNNYSTGSYLRRPLLALKDATDHLYVHNCEKLWSHEPGLLDSLNLDEIGSFLNREFFAAQMFIGNNNLSGTYLHCANNFNIFYQLKGSKKWEFINPEYTFFTYPLVSEDSGYFGSLYDWSSEFNELNLPLYQYCPRYVSEIHAGELLLNPPWWWHSVSSITKETISVATRWGPVAFSTLVGNRRFLRDIPDTNHMLTSLQLFSPAMLTGLTESVDYLIQRKLGNAIKGPSSRIIKDGTLFEEKSHDKLAEELINGNIYREWGIDIKKPREEITEKEKTG